ncbi:hypothetical protein [Pollutibacter soli]|uniref:hypothetical protein n=1 Tax=Pollutibacter soli TaxID=3034157 RepID=UPI003013AA05
MKEHTAEKNFEFIKSKINDIRSALFTYSDIDEVTYPTCIVSALRVDNNGTVWFLMNKSKNQYLGADQKFAAQLSFYRKGFPFKLSVCGKADIIHQPQVINEIVGLSPLESGLDTNEILLVKMQILKATYVEWRGVQPETWFKKLYHRFMQWLDSSLIPFERELEYQFN